MHKIESAESTLELLQAWVDAGWIRALDLAFARFLQQQGGQQKGQQREQQGEILLLAALLSHQVGRGHVCLPLQQMLAAPGVVLNLPPAHVAEAETVMPEAILNSTQLAQFERALSASAAVSASDRAGHAEPLVYDAGALYLRRFWQYEQNISDDLRQRMQGLLPVEEKNDQPRHEELCAALNELFPAMEQSVDPDADPLSRVNWQKLACANALRSRLSIITGGPGTGKTYTVVRLLAMLQRFSAAPLKIKLAAPTGKAAARLKTSIQSAVEKMTDSSVSQVWHSALQRIQSDSSTLHKLLGVQRGTRKFRHNALNPLNLDVLIVDEASMIDIEMMDAMLAALPDNTRLVLLGDKDQLASVEAGAVLGQLCAGAEEGRYRTDTFDYLQSFSDAPIAGFLQDPQGPDYLQHVVMLRVSRRFSQSSGIGHLAAAINDGNAELAQQLICGSGYDDIRAIATEATAQQDTTQAMLEQLRSICQQGFKAYWQVLTQRPEPGADEQRINTWASAVLNTYAQFQLLTPVRDGDFGVEGLNQQVERWLSFISPNEHWYEGRPVMVTENDYGLNLRNGDIGIVLVSPQDGRKRVVFMDSDGAIRWLLPSRLRRVQTVFAMTVHKSQGSEFNHAVMVMPGRDNPVLTRELVYTGVTRAASALTMVVPDWQVFRDAIKRQTQRAGNLRL